MESGRGERIRTSDHVHPMHVRYQAALRPEGADYSRATRNNDKTFTRWNYDDSFQLRVLATALLVLRQAVDLKRLRKQYEVARQHASSMRKERSFRRVRYLIICSIVIRTSPNGHPSPEPCRLLLLSGKLLLARRQALSAPRQF